MTYSLGDERHYKTVFEDEQAFVRRASEVFENGGGYEREDGTYEWNYQDRYDVMWRVITRRSQFMLSLLESERKMANEYRDWLEKEDALHPSHKDFFPLNVFLEDKGSRHYLCLGTKKSSCDVARYEFVNVDGKPSPKTQFIIKDCCGYTLMKLTPPELYYYMHLVYQRCIEEDEPQEEIEEFAKDLAYFRDVCGVRCDENGNPVLEPPPEEQDDV